jgi:hypothetical protein
LKVLSSLEVHADAYPLSSFGSLKKVLDFFTTHLSGDIIKCTSLISAIIKNEKVRIELLKKLHPLLQKSPTVGGKMYKNMTDALY